MNGFIRFAVLGFFAAFGSHALAADAAASWPPDQIRVIVPAGAGGDTDFNARTMATYFQKLTGKQMVIENQGKSGGTMAMAEVKAAPPDGKTILFGHVGHLVVNEVSGVADYGFEAFETACVAGIDRSAVLVASGKSGIRTVSDLIKKAKVKPESVAYATELGGFTHLQGILLQNAAGVKFKIVNAGAAVEKIKALTAGNADVASISFGAVKDHVFGGAQDLNIIAQFNSAQNALLGLGSGGKTFKEQGVNFAMEKPYVIAFPKGTDPSIVKKMSDVMKRITEQNGYARSLAGEYKQPVAYMNTDDSLAYLRKMRHDYMQYKDQLRQKN